jgi:multiple sugar transport system permease protein
MAETVKLSKTQLMKEKKKFKISDIIIFSVLTLGAVSMVIPFLWMISSSLKFDKDIFNFPIQWIPQEPKWINYPTVWKRAPFHLYYLNTIKIAASITILQIITCSMTAYSFAKLKYWGRDKIFLGYLATLMVPFQVIMIPQFLIIKKLGLVDSHMALILIGAFSPFGVFLLRQFFLGIPEELSESARIDGATEFQIYWKIIMPLAKPALASLGIFTFVHGWNDFLGPLIYLNSASKKTIQLAIRIFQTQYGNEYALIMSAAVCAVIPIIAVYLFAQRYFIEGIALTGIKG